MRGHPDFDAGLDAASSEPPFGAGLVFELPEPSPESTESTESPEPTEPTLPAIVLTHRAWRAAIRDMHAAGHRDAAIAEELGVSVCTVRRHRRRMGLVGLSRHVCPHRPRETP